MHSFWKLMKAEDGRGIAEKLLIGFRHLIGEARIMAKM